MAQCNVQTLLKNAACFACLSPGEWEILELQLLCEIQNSSGGTGSGAVCGNYTGGQPNFTPASGCGIAIDSSNGTVWYYYSGSWHSTSSSQQRPQTLWAQAHPGDNGGVPGASILNQTDAYGSLAIPANFFKPGKILYFSTRAVDLVGDITPAGPLRMLFSGNIVGLDWTSLFIANGGCGLFEAWISAQDPLGPAAHVRAFMRAVTEDVLIGPLNGGNAITHSDVQTITLDTTSVQFVDVLDFGYGINFDSSYFQLI
jgi:hypothetical protein